MVTIVRLHSTMNNDFLFAFSIHEKNTTVKYPTLGTPTFYVYGNEGIFPYTKFVYMCSIGFEFERTVKSGKSFFFSNLGRTKLFELDCKNPFT